MFYNLDMKNKILNYDVVIIGGGTSGCACAYNCAKNNLKTLLVEKNNHLGGLMTSGLVVPVMKSSVDNLNCTYYKKLISVSKKINAQYTYKDGNDGWFNPELLKISLETILSESRISKNLDILFETNLESVDVVNKKIKQINLNSNLLSLSIKSKYFVDASGNGILSKLSGCHFLQDNLTKQQNSLRFIVGNVDFKKLEMFLINLEDDENITNTNRNDSNLINKFHFTTASTWDETRLWKLDKYLKKAISDKVLKPIDRAYFQIFSVAGSSNCVAFNCPRIDNYSDDPFKASLELIKAKKAIYRIYKFVKLYIAGFENSEIVNIATQTGYREENRVKGKYVYTKDDIINSKTFDNPVLSANYSIDIHSKNKNKNKIEFSKISKYQLPIESLMSFDVNNLFIIGKILSADFEAHSALRVQKSCMSMGEGVAKYILSIL